MAVQSTTNINIDFYDKKHILINAKQFDKKSRFLLVTCYNRGELCRLYTGEHSAYIRYKKPDGYCVFNFCEIDTKGRVLIEVTEQMLACAGICCADLVIVNKKEAKVDPDTGEIIVLDNASILSSMTFYVDVSETAVENSEIESSYEFNGLNVSLEKAQTEYTAVIRLAKSYAVGDADGVRENEDYDNSKYYYQQSFKSAGDAATSALNAANSEELADTHMHDALTYSQNAQTYMTNAKSYMDNMQSYVDTINTNAVNAKTSEQNAKSSEQNAKASETNAKVSENNSKVSETNANTYMSNANQSAANASVSEANAKTSETNAKSSETNASDSEANALTYMNNAKAYMDSAKVSEDNAKISETNASTSEINAQTYMNEAYASEQNAKVSEDNSKVSETNAEEYMNAAQISKDDALIYANKAQSYAVGGTDTRDGEDTDNAHYYYELIKNIIIGLDTGFIPMGTVSFSELSSVEKATGYVYNISDDFITDESFREGAGKQYTAGTNVYYTANGEWDCFGGVASPTATVSEVKDYLGI